MPEPPHGKRRDHDEAWYLRPLTVIVRGAMTGAAGQALRDLARDLDAEGADPALVDRIRERAATYDNVRVVRTPASTHHPQHPPP